MTRPSLLPSWKGEEKKSLKIRILSRISINQKGCWLWKLYKNKHGYGLIKIKNKMSLVHRVTYSLWKKDPEYKCVLHHCDIPECCNPKHLFLGTPNDNVQDMIKKNRIYDRRGDKNPRAKITDKEAKQMLILKKEGKSPREIAYITKHSFYSIENIVYRITFKHLEEL
jgi:hypothetical protein